ncbi:glycoside hydrolase family 5 protein [Chloroflexia bacterium SDU3-3]|nr:glycoside hydrolase family 5 protein [Chloroflexia bacterium SDU3-3]
MARAAGSVGFHVVGRNLVDANGNNFIIRGTSHAYTWYTSQNASFANIKAAGANTVRVVLSNGKRWNKTTPAEVTTIINLCKTNRLICVLEVHDTTGYGEEGAAATLAEAAAYWREIQSVLTGQEAYVIINIGNEPYGNTNATGWIADTKGAIASLRSAGFKHMIMVDAPYWGQDWGNVMRDNAPDVFASDPDKNTVFSVHMYGVYDTAAEITSYVSSFVTRGLPLVIGEFGFNHSDGNPDEDTIMAQAQSQGIGYMAWSWSGNGGGVEYLDMVTGFDPTKPTSWGTRVISGANGFRETSVEASVYGTPVTTTPVTATPVTPTPVTVTPTKTVTATPVTPTATPVTPTPVTVTPTSTPGAACSPVSATISAPFSYDGAGSFCWKTSSLGSYVNSWNMTSLTINGVSFTNKWASSGSFPAAIDGYWYISYSAPYAWSHFEAK